MNDQSETIVISTEERAIFQSLAGQVIACALQNALTIIIVVSDMAKGLHSLKLEEILKKELQTTQCQGLGFAGGGCISEGKSFDTDHGRVFVKVNDQSGVFMPTVTLLSLSQGESPFRLIFVCACLSGYENV